MNFEGINQNKTSEVPYGQGLPSKVPNIYVLNPEFLVATHNNLQKAKASKRNNITRTTK